MSADWELDLAAPWTATQALERVRGVLGGTVRENAVFAGGMYVTVTAPSPAFREMLHEAFGFTPTVSLTFHRKLVEGEDEARYDHDIREIGRAVAVLTEDAGGDAVLLFNGETPVLQRRRDLVSIDPHWSDWLGDGFLAALRTPHEVRPLPSPL